MYAMVLEALQDRLSMDTQTIQQFGSYTIINEAFSNDFNAISEYKFLLAPIEHTVHDGEQNILLILTLRMQKRTKMFLRCVFI